MIKVAINGFGRIGRSVFRHILDKHPDLQIVAINDLTDTVTLSHLLKYDSVYGIYNKAVKAEGNILAINDMKVRIFAEKEPGNLPWKDLDVDVVLECTGQFTDKLSAGKHLEAGAKVIIVSAPSKDKDIPSYVLGVNAHEFDTKYGRVIDMGSCTTNCLAPVLKVLNDNFKVERGFMTTAHSYTNDQRILDLPHKDLRRARAAAINLIPTSTGASKAIGKVIKELDGKMDGIAIRVPTPVVSILDLICDVSKKTTAEEVNYAFKKASESKEMRGILGVEDAPLVSSDYIGNSFSAIVDSSLTMVKDTLIKVVAWYDNEWAYSCRLAEFAEFIGKRI